MLIYELNGKQFQKRNDEMTNIYEYKLTSNISLNSNQFYIKTGIFTVLLF